MAFVRIDLRLFSDYSFAIYVFRFTCGVFYMPVTAKQFDRFMREIVDPYKIRKDEFLNKKIGLSVQINRLNGYAYTFCNF